MALGSVDVHHKSRVHYVSRVIRLHSFFPFLIIPCIPTGLSQNTCFRTTLVTWRLIRRSKLNYLYAHCIVKSNHEFQSL